MASISSFEDQDPLEGRLALMYELIQKDSIDVGHISSIKQDATIINTFSLTGEFEKMELLVDGWLLKMKDPAQVLLISSKWSVCLEIAIEASDLPQLSGLLKICGKHKSLCIPLSLVAVALEKQDDEVAAALLGGCSAQKQIASKDGLLAMLPEAPARARQVLFDRYCIVPNEEIIKELFEGTGIPVDVSNTDLEELGTEHRVAMISFLSRGAEKIVVSEDTLWSAVKAGNSSLAQLLHTLKMDTAFCWMESQVSSAQLQLNLSVSAGSGEASPAESFNGMLALYSAYGGKVSGLEPRLQKELKDLQELKGQDRRLARSFSGLLKRTSSFSSSRSSSIVSRSGVKGLAHQSRAGSNVASSAMARAIIDSHEDKDWMRYLRGEATDASVLLSWMEPAFTSSAVTLDSISGESKAPVFAEEDAMMTILEGLGGTSSYSQRA